MLSTEIFILCLNIENIKNIKNIFCQLDFDKTEIFSDIKLN